MPIIANAKKALRQSKTRAIRNKVVRAKIRTAIKNGDLTPLYSVVDKAVKNHLINKNKAARIKSRASSRVANQAKLINTPVKPLRKKATPKVKKPVAKVKKTAVKVKKTV